MCASSTATEVVRITSPEPSMRLPSRLLLLCAFISWHPLGAQAKVDRRVQERENISVRLADGSVIYGVLERADADSVVMTGTSGRMAFANSRVRLVRPAGEAHKRADGSNEYWFPNSNTTRLFFAPTGRTLERG